MWVIINDDGTTEVYKAAPAEVYKAPTVKKKSLPKKQPKIITKKKPIKCKHIDKKIMYLTFDDGPLLGSNNIITVLQEENVEATMFMVGKHIQKSKFRQKTFRRALDEPLVMVANHTYTHANGRYRHFYSDKERVLNDIEKMDTLLFSKDPNYQVPYCRLAGRNVFRLPSIYSNDPGIPKKYNEKPKYDALWNAGYYLFGWDYQWSYNPKSGEVYNSPKKMVTNIESIYKKGRTKTSGKFVLLMHDFSFRNKFDGKERLRGLIRELKKKGWQFETLATYL